MYTEAAPVVKRIFDLCIDGKGPEQISRILERDQVLTTKALYASRKGKPLPKNPYGWKDQSIVGILERQEYTGCTCNFKAYSKSYNCNCFDYIITSNGCDLRDLKKNVTIDCKTLSQETVEQVIALLKQYRVYFECFIQGQAVTEKNLIEILKADADVYADYLQGGGDCVQSVDNFKDYIPQETLAVSKLYVMAGSPQQAAEIRSALQSVQGLSCTSSGAQNIEVIPPFVDKADAVEEMARYVGISLSEVISIGDGENDMEMIRRCGCGIAMENGLQELQACADYICPSVSNEGAADAIEYFLGL